MKKIGIVGLGLIGGSLARAIRKNFPEVIIAATDNSEKSLAQAFADGVINEYSVHVNEIFLGSEIIFICTPVNLIASYIREVTRYVSEKCIITDVGSIKGGIYKEISHKNICYIGGHPMAGSEKFGFENSRENLFVNAYYILTPYPNTEKEKVELLKSIIHSIGAIPIVMEAQRHDFIAAAISHAPHVIASALVNMVNALDNENKNMQLLAGGGFKDITRIASSNPEMWQNISLANKDELLKTIDEFRSQLDIFEDYLKQDNTIGIYDFFKNAKQYRDYIIHSQNS